MSFEIKGIKGMQQRIDRIARRIPNEAEQALRIEGEVIMTRSKQEFVPVDLGALRSSGHVSDPVRHGKDVEVTLSFGGAAAPYALAVHEHPGDYDPPSWQGKDVEFHPSGRGPKYLERPLKDAVRGMAARIAEKIEAGIAGLLLLGLLSLPAAAQVSGISPRAFGSSNWRESVASVAALPATGNTLGHLRFVRDVEALYWWDGDSWESLAGTQGPQGEPGEPGAPGADGKTVRSGSGIPSSGLGVDGDFYLDTAATAIYGPKTAGVWGSGVSLIGPAGADGADGSPGAAGANGATWFSGSGAPSGGTGANGDFYFRTATGDVYSKASGLWSIVANLTGPAGTQGPPGDTGPAGPAPSGAANLVLATPSLASGTAALRSLVASDLPGTLLFADGTLAAPSISFAGETGLGISRNNNALYLSKNGYYFGVLGYSDTFYSRGGFRSWGDPFGPFIAGIGGSTSAPEILPNQSDGDTGIHGDGANQIDIVAGGSLAGASPFSILFDGVRVPTGASPPCSCPGSSCKRTLYYDTSDALCLCGASAWINLSPTDGGSCS